MIVVSGRMTSLVAVLVVLLGAATPLSASCGNGVLDHDPLKRTTEQCDRGKATCSGGLRDGQTCATENNCVGGNCSGGDPGDAGPATDNRDDIANSCRTDCTLPVCGDGVTDSDVGETCDDGNSSNGDGCLDTCKEAFCGDGFVCSENNPRNPCTSGTLPGGKEQCDDGNGKGGDGCSPACTVEVCGDGVRNASESCDSGQAICTGGLRDGSPCATAAGCFGGTCGVGNRDDVANSCRSDCALPHCGDGVVDSLNEEDCDDANASDNDGCTNQCKVNVCGDGFACTENNSTSPCNSTPGPFGKEECDDGNGKTGDGCDGSCALESCGNGVVEPSETCDTGEASCSGSAVVPDGTLCATTAACIGGTCGAGNRDDLADHCRSNCTLPRCGDGVVDPANGELCDDGNASNHDGCTSDCRVNVCGDGFVCTENNPKSPCASTPGPYGKEQCDDGNVKNRDGCDANCALESCGNGAVEPSEACDVGQASCSGSALVPDGTPCATAADCFGGTCGAGNRDDLADHCRSNCALPRCGDGAIDSGEVCDDGNTSNNDTCLGNCRDARCGDGNVCWSRNLKDPSDPSNCTTGPGGGPEECDDGTPESTIPDGCVACALTSCGDGVVQSGEECDSGQSTCVGSAIANQIGLDCTGDANCGPGGDCAGGNLNEADTCRPNCRLPACGDGLRDTGEACDDGNQGDTDACTGQCQEVACGDGAVQVFAGETCDDGNMFSGDGCAGMDSRAACRVERCGDGVVDASVDPTADEECDAGWARQYQGSCTSVCCWYGEILSAERASSVSPAAARFRDATGAFDSVTDCHLPKLVANASCTPSLERLSLRVAKLVSDAKVAYAGENARRATRKLRRAEQLLQRIDRALMKARSAGACESIEHVLNDQKNRIVALGGDLQNLMQTF